MKMLFSTIKKTHFVLGILLCIGYNSSAQEDSLVWSDEFDVEGLPDTTRWSYDKGGHGWGNNELQYYTASDTDNARIENGTLIIEAHKENFESKEYTSARLVSKNKGDWLYGKIEVRAKLPSGRGTWPAIWMLSTDWIYGGWPESGEIDIMEHVGYNMNVVQCAVHTKAYNHTKDTQKGAKKKLDNVADEFHTYSIEWEFSEIRFFIDSEEYFKFTKEEGWGKWPFDKRFHVVLNIAVGGNWGGKNGVDESIWPQKMIVDFVRIYQVN